MSLKLFQQAITNRPAPRMWRAHELKDRYAVVIIGGGAHGLGCAYYLAKEYGITDVAVLEKKYIGAGGSGRNTAIIRSNYITSEGVPFYDASMKLYQGLSQELDFNLMYSQRGNFTLAHSESAVRTMRRRAEVNQILGVDSRVIYRDEIAQLCPYLDLSDRPHLPIQAALYHPPGSIIRHDAVVWGYARQADRRGVHIHQMTEVTGIDVAAGRVTGVRTNRGPIKTEWVINATAGWGPTIATMVGIDLPLTIFPLQACVTESLKPFLDTIVVSGTLHIYVSQTDRGELVMGTTVDPYASYSMEASLPFLEDISGHLLDLFPSIGNVHVMRQWAGLCDMTPDQSPIMGLTPVKGFLLDVGWGTWGFKATPIAAKTMAELVATGKTPALIEPFRLARFEERDLVNEKGAAAVGN